MTMTSVENVDMLEEKAARNFPSTYTTCIAGLTPYNLTIENLTRLLYFPSYRIRKVKIITILSGQNAANRCTDLNQKFRVVSLSHLGLHTEIFL
jgi:hypothetical protein